MPAEIVSDGQDVPKDVSGGESRSGGDSGRRKRKHRGKYNPTSHVRHPGVAVVKHQGGFYLKWRTTFTKGDYRYQWERLPDEVTSKEAARGYAKTKSDELASNRQQARKRRPGAKHLLPVADGLDAYLSHLERKNRERGKDFIERSKVATGYHLAPFVAFIAKAGIKQAGKLKLDDLQDFRNTLDKSGLANVSINRCLDAVRAAMNIMRKERYIGFDQSEIGEALEHYDVTAKRPRVLDRDELRRLIAALAKRDRPGLRVKVRRELPTGPKAGTVEEFEQRDRRKPLTPFVALALLTGARPGEIEALTADDVREGHGNILIRAAKTNREREVPWHDSPLLRELALALKLRAAGRLLVGRVKRDRVERLGVAAKIGLAITKDADGNEVVHSDLNRQALRRTCVAHVAAGSAEGEGLLTFRFGHSTQVSIQHYRKALHGIGKRGDTVEAWLGIEDELRELLAALGYVQASDAESRQVPKRA